MLAQTQRTNRDSDIVSTEQAEVIKKFVAFAKQLGEALLSQKDNKNEEAQSMVMFGNQRVFISAKTRGEVVFDFQDKIVAVDGDNIRFSVPYSFTENFEPAKTPKKFFASLVAIQSLIEPKDDQINILPINTHHHWHEGINGALWRESAQRL